MLTIMSSINREMQASHCGECSTGRLLFVFNVNDITITTVYPILLSQYSRWAAMYDSTPRGT